MTADPDAYILTFACRDRVGIVAAVAGFLAAHDGFILDSQQFADCDSDRFFMRVVFRSAGPRFPAGVAALTAAFRPIAADLALDSRIVAASAHPRIVVAVSKGSHCLNDLLHRWSTGALPVDIAAVVSNHDDCRRLADWHGVPYHHLPVTADTRGAQERALLDVLADTGSELLVLARYMQVLSADLTQALAGRCINIHHSFLPGFKGARPYHRAHARGVKLIGATAHFVTADLDQGPIIAQSVERVDHRDTVDDLIRIGRDVEARVLAEAVGAFGERRLFLNGDRTVLFR